MRLTIRKPKQPAGAVEVSLNLQRAVVVLVSASIIVQLIATVAMYAFSDVSYSARFAWTLLAFNVLPAVVFVCTYLLTPRYPLVINRLFIATVKAVAVFSAYLILESSRNYFLQFYANNNPHSGPDWWMTSPLVDYGLVAICIAGFIYLTYHVKRTK